MRAIMLAKRVGGQERSASEMADSCICMKHLDIAILPTFVLQYKNDLSVP
jgi:hypothetical protein